MADFTVITLTVDTTDVNGNEDLAKAAEDAVGAIDGAVVLNRLTANFSTPSED